MLRNLRIIDTKRQIGFGCFGCSVLMYKLIMKGPLMPLQYDEGEDIVVVRYEDIKDVIRKGELK